MAGPTASKHMAFATSFFITVASVLGTGILALPVELYKTGFYPFLLTFIVCLAMQILAALFMIELLQRAHWAHSSKLGDEESHPVADDPKAHPHRHHIESPSLDQQQTFADAKIPATATIVERSHSHLSMEGASETPGEMPPLDLAAENHEEVVIIHASDENEFQSQDLAQPSNKDLDHGEDAQKEHEKEHATREGTDLHAISLLYLPHKAQFIFNAGVLLQFISIMISYTLAGSQAYAALFHTNPANITIPLWLILTIFVVFGESIMAHVVSAMTLVKGSFLVAMVFVIGGISQQVRQPNYNSWSSIGDPFLVGTVALGGAINNFPVIYAKISPTRENLKAFRAGVISALSVCALLNILWCKFILDIVPQVGDGTSLENAAKLGQIATAPLIAILQSDFPSLRWMSFIITVFIALSITVSYLTMGSGLKHLLDGYARQLNTPSLSDPANKRQSALKALFSTFSRRLERLPVLAHYTYLYILFYGFILTVALTNPQGFINVLEVFASLAVNITAGVLLCVMLARSWSNHHQAHVPLPLSKKFFALRHVVLFYFAFAVVYAIYVEISEFVIGH